MRRIRLPFDMPVDKAGAASQAKVSFTKYGNLEFLEPYSLQDKTASLSSRNPRPKKVQPAPRRRRSTPYRNQQRDAACLRQPILNQKV